MIISVTKNQRIVVKNKSEFIAYIDDSKPIVKNVRIITIASITYVNSLFLFLR